MTRTVDLLSAKRDGREHSEEELYAFAASVATGEIPDYQASAWLMAAWINGLSARETTSLTLAMRDSGSVLKWGAGLPTADKHSTGGVGDKVSLILAPLAAQAGLRVPMISGRSLGHTGGTLDKLESIPGMRVDLDLERFVELVDRNGVAMCSQTERLAPADRKLYALRDATATVTSIPLISASILSKKLAEGVGTLVFDVKEGSGAFIRGAGMALKLAGTLVETARGCGVKACALITSMDRPLGMMTGNALEVRESMEVLGGGGPRDLRELTLELVAGMLVLADPDRFVHRETAAAFAAGLLDDGSARSRFVTMVSAQGGDLDAFDALKPAPVQLEVLVDRSGLWSGVDAFAMGEAVRSLGGGRYRMEDRVDHSVGWEQLVLPDTWVSPGQAVGLVHGADRSAALAAALDIRSAFLWDTPGGPMVRGVV
jgi:pyrimidine-nucleoside phosphorylase